MRRGPACDAPHPPRFATVQPSGLLFYNGRLNEKHDFLALELVAGQVRLTYSTGGCPRGLVWARVGACMGEMDEGCKPHGHTRTHTSTPNRQQ